MVKHQTVVDDEEEAPIQGDILDAIDMTNSYQFSCRPITNIIFFLPITIYHIRCL